MYARCTLSADSPRTWQPFMSHQQSWAGQLLPKKGSWHNPQHADWPVRESVPSFSPDPTLKLWGQSQAYIDSRLLGLLGLYHQHAIGTFNTYSQVPTPRSLTDTGGGYHIETLESPQHSPHHLFLSVPLIPLIDPAWSPFYLTLITDSKV
jgi:hypothetical protein